MSQNEHEGTWDFLKKPCKKCGGKIEFLGYEDDVPVYDCLPCTRKRLKK